MRLITDRSVDVANERRIRSLIKNRLLGKTIISILHRLETAVEYDRSFVLNEGRLAQFGTPEEVTQDSDLFSLLVNQISFDTLTVR